MEDNPDIFPAASIQNVLRKIKKGASAFRNLQEYVIHFIKTIDKNADGVISFKEFCDGLKM